MMKTINESQIKKNKIKRQTFDNSMSFMLKGVDGLGNVNLLFVESI